MLKETPVLHHIAETICAQAIALRDEIRTAEEEAAEAQREAQEASAKAKEAVKRRWRDVRANRDKLAGARASVGKVTAAIKNDALQRTEEENDAERRNEQAKKSGAFTLSYSTDPSLYWTGLTALTGPPTSQVHPTYLPLPIEMGLPRHAYTYCTSLHACVHPIPTRWSVTYLLTYLLTYLPDGALDLRLDDTRALCDG